VSRTLVAVAAALSVTALGIAAWSSMETAALREEVRALRRDREGRAPAAGAAAGGAAAEGPGSEAVAEGGLPPGRGGGAPSGEPGPGSPGEAAARVAAGTGSRESLRGVVRDLLREEMEARAAKEAAAGAKPPAAPSGKPPLSQFAAELELTGAQRDEVRQAVIRGQESMIALLRTPTAEGRVPVDELLDAMLGKPEEAQPKVVEIFGLLATETVPGTEETYAKRIEAVKRETVEAFRRGLTAEQFQAYEKTGQDPLEIQVPDSPWVEVLQDAYRRRKR